MTQELHPDDAAVERLGVAQKAELASKRAQGYGGWDTDCTQQRLSGLLRAAVAKGNPVKVANYCAFLHARGESISPPMAQAAAAIDVADRQTLVAASGILTGHGYMASATAVLRVLDTLQTAQHPGLIAAPSIPLTEQDAGLLNQGIELLEGLAASERARGNDSEAEGAACSAHAVQRLGSALLAAQRAMPAVQAPILFNPYTGTPRHPLDIESDPKGILIVPPGAALRATPAEVVASKFFSFDPSEDLEVHDTAEAAQAAAQKAIDLYREDSGEGWDEDTGRVCWGVVLGQAVEVELEEKLPDDAFACGVAGYMDPVDYVLQSPAPKEEAAPSALNKDPK